jgi:hypothetical protein
VGEKSSFARASFEDQVPLDIDHWKVVSDSFFFQGTNIACLSRSKTDGWSLQDGGKQ